MSLQIRLPLDKDARNVGLQSGITAETTTSIALSGSPFHNGPCYFFTTVQNIGISGIDYSQLTSATISFWAYHNALKNTVFFTGPSTSHFLGAVSGNGQGSFYHGKVGGSKISYVDGYRNNNLGEANKWHHYVFTDVNLSAWTGTTLKFNNYSSNWNVAGRVYDMRIYDHVLCDDDIKRLYGIYYRRTLLLNIPFNVDSRNVGLINVKTHPIHVKIEDDYDFSGNCADFASGRRASVQIDENAFTNYDYRDTMSMAFFIKRTELGTSFETPIGILRSTETDIGSHIFAVTSLKEDKFLSFVMSDGMKEKLIIGLKELELNVLYHICIVYDSSSNYCCVYIDGEKVKELKTETRPLFKETISAMIGARDVRGLGQTKSKMSNVRFYSFPLTDYDVQRIYCGYENIDYLEFEGLQYVLIPNPNPINSMKIVLDFCPDSASHDQPTLMGVRGKTFQLYRSSTTNMGLWWKSGGSYSLGPFIPNAHNMLELRFDASTFSYVLNGTSNSYSNTELFPIVKGGDLLIGGYNPGTSFPFFGKIYRIQVYADDKLINDLISCKKNGTKEFFDNFQKTYFNSMRQPF